MAATILRKLSRKSILKFGKFSDLSVQDLLNMALEGKTYLAWCYYHLSMISFLPDVLEELGIDPKLQIEKPGTYHYRYFDWKKESLTDNERMGNASRLKGNKTRKRKKAATYDSRRFSKNSMQKRNQGH